MITRWNRTDKKDLGQTYLVPVSIDNKVVQVPRWRWTMGLTVLGIFRTDNRRVTEHHPLDGVFDEHRSSLTAVFGVKYESGNLAPDRKGTLRTRKGKVIMDYEPPREGRLVFLFNPKDIPSELRGPVDPPRMHPVPECDHEGLYMREPIPVYSQWIPLYNEEGEHVADHWHRSTWVPDEPNELTRGELSFRDVSSVISDGEVKREFMSQHGATFNPELQG